MGKPSPQERNEACRSIFGSLPRSVYPTNVPHSHIDALEYHVKEWLETSPGSYASKSGVDPYREARRDFERFSRLSVTSNSFEIALANEGYRCGSVVTGGGVVWLLLLPKRKNVHE